jgi:hypothetical protein
MQMIVVALVVWCSVSLVIGLALGRVLGRRTVELPECPDDAHALVGLDEEHAAFATR